MKELLKAKSEFRKKGVVLTADKVKSGAGGSWRFAGEDNLIKTIQKPLSECGLELIVTMEYLKELGTNTVKATLFHIESGESISSQLSLPEVVARSDKNGNYMYLDAEIERGKQFGYWSRTLTIRILGLSDLDPEDTNNRPSDMSDDTIELKEELRELIRNSKDPTTSEQWVVKTYSVASVEVLTFEQLKHVINLLKQKSKNENSKS